MIEKKSDNCVIVCAGPSLKDFNFSLIRQNVDIISVNTTIYRLPRATFWFSLDPSPIVIEIMKIKPNKTTKYFCAVDDSIPENIRKIPGIYYLKRIRGDGIWGSKGNLSEIPGEIHTGNSGFGALGLAYLLGYKKILFLGLDGMTGSHWCDNKPTRDLSHLPTLFESTVYQLKSKNIQVLNGNPKSRVICFNRINALDAVDWINEIK